MNRDGILNYIQFEIIFRNTENSYILRYNDCFIKNSNQSRKYSYKELIENELNDIDIKRNKDLDYYTFEHIYIDLNKLNLFLTIKFKKNNNIYSLYDNEYVT